MIRPIRVDVVIGDDPVTSTYQLRGIAQYATRHGGWQFRIHNREHAELLRELAASDSDGLLTVLEAVPLAQGIARLGRPAVNLYGNVPHDLLSTVTLDEAQIGQMGAQHLLAQGFRRFAFCGVNMSWSQG